METRRSQLRRLRAVAATAVADYDLPDGRLTFLTHGENTTFRLDGPAGRRLVRVHRPQRHGRSADAATVAIRSEIAWLTALRADTDLEVPAPVLTRSGAASTRAQASGLTRDVSVLGWLPGRIHEDHPRPVHLRRLGAAMASLHRHADTWSPPPGFSRISWNHAAFFGDVMVYGDVPAAECWTMLPADLRARFDRVAERLDGVMAADPDTGLIHADLHTGNAVFEGDRVGLIDFDDCGFGPRLYDLAVAVWERRDEPDYPEYRDALVAGYTAHRDIDLTHLDDYIAARQVGFDLWYTGTARVNAAFAARLDVVHRWSADMIDLLDAARA
ncbi:phosphotransferase enzyme family protein [Microbacterium hominis]|uniref:Phosphotransferase n=1 Tax=Microbacterium hominis TaxID=162426 RepID=A0A7D4TDS7_9MICO|nr:phosphotransferase [Microbacterium hominis]QKJ18340.1 phosphotransferase [Microbacterium hominis]